MHVRCEGSGSATVVLLSGFEGAGDSWSAVTPTVSARARVCSSDKFGTGTSDPATGPQTFATQADSLRQALRTLGEPGPFVVVGHSFGGAEAVTFAAAFRSEVIGVVLVDASPTTWQAAVCSVPDDGSAGAPGYRQVCAMTSSPSANAERLDGPAAFAAVGTITSLDDLPMAVLTASTHDRGLTAAESARLEQIWRTGQEQWASLSPSARVTSVDGSGHNIQIDRPAVVIEQVLQLLP